MLRKILKIFIFLFFINSLYAAKEGSGYNRGLKKNIISKITKNLDNNNYEKAISLLKVEIAKDKKNAELYNLMGYAYRNLNNFDLSIKNYKKALNIKPNHLGVHNYIGIAYLRIGNLYKAKVHLLKLRELCKGKCNEYKNLKKELSDNKKNE